MKGFRSMTFLWAAAAALMLGGCGGSNTKPTLPVDLPATMLDPATMPDPETMPDPTIAEREDIKMKIMTARTAVNAVNDDSADDEVSAADAAIMAAKMAIAAAGNVPAEEKAAYTETVTVLEAQLSGARMARTEAMEAADLAERMAMMRTAMKLYAGIGSAPLASTGDGARIAAYDTDGNIEVRMGTAAAVDLSEDEEMMVAANHGWEGKRYTRSTPATDGMYEAVVFGAPQPGDKFSMEYAGNIVDGTLNEATTEGTASRVASPSFDHSAGVKSFKLPAGNTAVTISGSFHGVPGTYSCEPGDGNTCAARVATSGFDLGGVTGANVFGAGNAVWTFRPDNPDALVLGAPDADHASYGWWLHKPAGGGDYVASAFTARRGTVPNATGIGALRGTATYMGGAAGMYALSSLTGGTNDAGRFTARAMLEVDFHDDMVTGTIDDFTGADGQSRNWSVELKKSGIGDTGTIRGADGDPNSVPMKTVWTIDGKAVSDSGEWFGNFRDNGDDGVPKVATGAFYSEYGHDGRMVGAFGAVKVE